MGKPIHANWPQTEKKVMGNHGWMNGSYCFYDLKNPIKSELYRPPWVVGGIHNPTIDPNVHFSTQDRFTTCDFSTYWRAYWNSFSYVRAQLFMAYAPAFCIIVITIIEQRREPMEIFMDRETCFEDFDSYCFGVYFDHHHFSHMLDHRRAHKWGYAGQDITLEHGD